MKIIILLLSLFIVKLDASVVNTTNTSGINEALTYTFDTFGRPSLYLYYTNKFNCNSTGCSVSNFNNIGIISVYEYETYNKKYSYLTRDNSYFGLENNVIKNINKKLIENVSNETISGVRPTVYVKKGVRVTGNGSANDPWMFTKDYNFTLTFNPNGGEVNPKSKIVTFGETYGSLPTPVKVGNTFDGWYLEDTFKNKIDENVIVEKYGDSVAYAKWKINNYMVKVVVSNGYTSNPEQTINYNESATFDITANNGYKLDDASISCSNYTYNAGKLVIKNITSNQTCTITLKEKSIYLAGTLSAKILENNSIVNTRTDFSLTYTYTTTGTIFKKSSTNTEQWTEDTNGDGVGEDVYYFAGNHEKNWVNFGGFYWRIIRINEDGSVRLLYSGTSPSTTSGHIGEIIYNTPQNDKKYVGYMYGSSGTLADNRKNTNSSNAKKEVDSWYKKNLLTNYDKYISRTAIYCNDRSDGQSSGGLEASGKSTWIWFGAAARIKTYSNKTNIMPSYKCGGNVSGGLFESTQAIEDKFSASTTGGGNGQLTYPIALMTADEVSFAGGYINTEMTSPYAWYYTNSAGEDISDYYGWWTMSPYAWNDDATSSNNYCVFGAKKSGGICISNVIDDFVIRPVISLKSCVKYSSGDGSSGNAYKVTIDTSCSNALN